MNRIVELNDENFETFALFYYQNPIGREIEDFMEDLNRIKYIKRLMTRYKTSNVLSARLLMNHIIIFCNSFGIPAALRILEFKLPVVLWPVLKPFLLELNYIRDFDYIHIESDPVVIAQIRNM